MEETFLDSSCGTQVVKMWLPPTLPGQDSRGKWPYWARQDEFRWEVIGETLARFLLLL